MAIKSDSLGYSLLPTQGHSEVDASRTEISPYSGDAVDAGPVLDVVQFACPFYYVYENSGQAIIKVMRIGALSQPCTVDFSTEDNSAKAGSKYRHTHGRVTFRPDEEMKQIEIPIIRNAWFEPNLDFKVVLDSPQDCLLSEGLRTCRIMVIDEDIFPHNRFRENIEKHDLDPVGVRMLASFVYFCIKKVPLIGRRTYWNLFLDQFHNANYLLSIWLNVYLVDVVLVSKEGSEEAEHLWVPGHRLWTAVLVALALTLPKVVLSVIEHSQVGALAVAGKTSIHLKVNLFRKYLHYNSKSLASVSAQDLLACMDGDVDELVSLGFMVIFQLAQQFVKISVILFFLCHKRPSSALLLLPHPIGMVVVLNIRYLPTLKLYNAVMSAHLHMLSSVAQWCDDLSLIKEYHMRPQITGIFGNIVEKQLSPIRQYKEYDFRTMLVMPWITNLAIASFIVLGGYFVLDDKLTLGGFLAIIGIYKDAGQIFTSFYETLKNCYTVIGPLMRVVTQMNMGTSAANEIKVISDRSDGMQQQLTGRHAIETRPGVSRFDMLDIRMTGVSLATDHGGPQHSPLQDISISIPQGKMVAVLGSHGTGKYTMLRLLKGSVLPRRGQVHVPTHLRCICVPGTPQLFENGTLLDNLIFGSEGKYNKERLLQLCTLVGMSDFGMAMIKEQMEDDNSADGLNSAALGFDSATHQVVESDAPWYEQMSRSELLKMQILRGLYHDPEVLLLQRPVDELEADHAARILGLLRSFVSNRGILITPEQEQVARPHTVFFTSGLDRERAETASDSADIVLHLSAERGIIQEYGGAHFQQAGLTGNKIINSWCTQAQFAQAEFFREKRRHVAIQGVLHSVQSQLDSWEEEEKEIENDWYPFVDRSETKTRLYELRSMIAHGPKQRVPRQSRDVLAMQSGSPKQTRNVPENFFEAYSRQTDGYRRRTDREKSTQGHILRDAFVLL